MSKADKIIVFFGLLVAVVGAILMFIPENTAVKLAGASLALSGAVIAAVAAHKVVFPEVWQKYLKLD